MSAKWVKHRKWKGSKDQALVSEHKAETIPKSSVIQQRLLGKVFLAWKLCSRGNVLLWLVAAVKGPFVVPAQNSCLQLKGGSGEKRLNTFSLNSLWGNTDRGVNLLSCWLLTRSASLGCLVFEVGWLCYRWKSGKRSRVFGFLFCSCGHMMRGVLL